MDFVKKHSIYCINLYLHPLMMTKNLYILNFSRKQYKKQELDSEQETR
jgi:hypothetical protein